MMKRLIHATRNLRLTTKIFILTFVMVETIILILVFTYHRQSSSALLNAQTEYASQLIQRSDEYMKLNFTYIQYFFMSISQEVQLKNRSNEEYDDLIKKNLILYMPNSKHMHLIQDDNVLASSSLNYWALMEDEYFLNQIAQVTVPNQIYWFGPYTSPVSQNTITAAIQIPSEDSAPLYLALDLDLVLMYNALRPNNSIAMQSDLLLLDRNNQPINGSSNYVYYDVFQRKSILIGLDESIFKLSWSITETTLNNKELFMTRSRSNLLGWQIIWIMDKTELLKPLQRVLDLIWPLAFLSVLFSIGIAYTISLYINRPIKRITASMDQVSTGNFDVSIRINRSDELGMLAKHFNRMTHQIKILIANLKMTEEKKKAADFVALQAQIRPHFLYNTLNTISIVARQGQLNKVDQLISSLTDQLQYNLDSSPKPATLREELKALESYVLLMSTRYQNKFQLEMDIDSTTLEYVIPKFILQPIVENSIFHGLVPKSGHGMLFIGSSVEANGWEILIEDNGVGMTPMQLEQLTDRMNSESVDNHTPTTGFGIGMRNVHQRLQFMFGEAYHIKIVSRKSFGTTILIHLPSANSVEDQTPSLE